MAIARSQMYRQLYGIGNLVKREEYGLGSKLKKFVRNVIPNEVAEIAVKAAPFVAPFNPLLAGAMAGVGTFDRTGSISSGIKSGLINYGLGQVARGIGGAGFQSGFDPFAGANFSGGFTSGIQSLFTSPIGNVPFGSFTPTQQYYTGGADALTYNPDAIAQKYSGVYGSEPTIPANPRVGTVLEGPGGGTVVESLSLPSTDVAAKATKPGYVELIKQAGSLDPNVSISQRFDAVKDLSQKALQDIYTKPVRNAAGEIVDRELDKNMLISTAVTAGTYAEAIGLLSKAGDPNPEKTLSEADYQRLRVDPEKVRYASLKPEAFGIRNLSANGGIMDDMQSGVLSITLTPANREKFFLGSKGKNTSNNRISQIIQLIRDAESIGDFEKAEELRLDLFRETKKADGGIIKRENYGLGSGFKAVIGKVADAVVKPAEAPAQRAVSAYPVKDLYDYYLQNISDEDYKNRILDEAISRFANGGRINFRDAGPASPRAVLEKKGYKDMMKKMSDEDILKLYDSVMGTFTLPRSEEAKGGRIGYQVGGTINPFALTQRPDDLGLPGFDDDNLSQNREETLEEAMARGVIFYDPITGRQINRVGTREVGFDTNFITQRAMQAQQDAAARTLPVNLISRGASSNFLSPNQSMQQELLMRSQAIPTGGTTESISEGSSGISPLFRINRAIQAEQEAAARVTPKKANGGRINYFMGSEIPVRQNQGGITELDLRNKGGFIPVGIKEKADDVPAMLSKNEFVFTADAVRGAGKGSINKGAQKMYKLMKSLEKKVKKQKVK